MMFQVTEVCCLTDKNRDNSKVRTNDRLSIKVIVVKIRLKKLTKNSIQ
jgi:hypothetical protein